MRATALLLLVVSLGVARVAVAGDRDDARTEFAAGQQADKDKDYAGAIEHYMRANELKPHPFAVYNIAADYERLGQLREAARWYEQFIQTAPASPERDKVVRDLPELRLRPAALSVRSMPPGARVRIDGKNAGLTPLSITVPGGDHHIIVDRDADHAERDITLEYGEPGDVLVTLSGTPGALFVYGSPAGAQVAVDNVVVGVLPANVQVTSGPHTIRVTSTGFSPYETGVDVQPGQTQQVPASLQRDLSSVGAQTTPKIPFELSVGAIGGADLSNQNPIALGSVGLQLASYEGSLTLGYAGKTTEVALLFRWFVLPTVVAPYLTFGYAWGGIGFGYELNGGLRWDVSKGNNYGFSLLADFGFRTYSSTDSGSGGSVSGFTYPLELGARVVFR